MQSPQTYLVFLSVVALVALVEFIWRRRSGRGYDLGALGGTLGVFVGQVFAQGLTVIVVAAALSAAFAIAPIQWPMDHWFTWVALFFGVEFVYYWQHRFSHTIRWFWATHAVHHSPNEFTLPAAMRLGWTGGVTGNWVYYIALALIGFHPAAISMLLLINLRYQFFLHTEAVGKLGPLEWVLNTPSHHRVHHGSNPEYLDKNYGGVLIIFDRLFGTFQAERVDAPVVYGLTTPVTSNNPFVIALHEWVAIGGELKRAQSVREAGHILFARPGRKFKTVEDDQVAQPLRDAA